MSNSKYSIGVDLGGTSIKVGLVSREGKIIKQNQLESRAAEGPKAVISQIKTGINEMLDGAKYKVAGIGIGSPGLINHEKGSVENPPNFPGWEKVQLGNILKKEYNMNVFVENDANAAAIGEFIFGAGKKLNSFIMVTLGTGVGGGLIIDRKIYRGLTGSAGEIGHITVDYNGPKCNCGSYGCIEAYCGNNYLVRRIKSELSEHDDSTLALLLQGDDSTLTPKLISEAATLGGDYARSIIIDVAQKLGYGLASVVNLLDVCTIIIGGGVSGFGELLFQNVEETIKQRVMKPFRSRIKVKPARLKNEAGIKGASALVFYQS